MSPEPRTSDLGPLEETVYAFALGSLAQLCQALLDVDKYWGYYITPTKARLLYSTGEIWRDMLESEELQEVRIFNSRQDLRWLAERGVVLTRQRPDNVSRSTIIKGAAWLQRKRRSRLWGEWLEGTKSWYEERIPDPLSYEGLERGVENRYPFLNYREYIKAGIVRYVRYLVVEGAAK